MEMNNSSIARGIQKAINAFSENAGIKIRNICVLMVVTIRPDIPTDISSFRKLSCT